MRPLGSFIDLPDDLDAVTTHADNEVAPAEVGMTPSQVNAIWEAAKTHYATRCYPAVSLCLRRHGKVFLNRAIGHASGAGPPNRTRRPAEQPAVLATPDTPFCIFSASKAVTAILMHILDEKDLLRLNDPVCEYIDGFERRGKRWVTIRHVMTHRAGIPSIVSDADPLSLLLDPPRIIALLSDTKPTLAPGRRLAYHAVTGGFILGEVAARVTGIPVETLLKEWIAEPLGCTHLTYGVPAGSVETVAKNYLTGYPVPPPIGQVFKKTFGLPLKKTIAASNDPRFLSAVVPAGNVVATADDLCRFFQMLVDEGRFGDTQVMQRKTVRRARLESSYFELDLTLGVPVRYGQGLMLGARRLSPFGPDTRMAFGHYGFVTMVGWADPERAISGALLSNGKPIIGNFFPSVWKLFKTIAKETPKV